MKIAPMKLGNLASKISGRRSTTALEWVGRGLLTGIFIAAGISKIKDREGTLAYMKSKKLPANPVTLNGAIGMELGVAPLLALGVFPRYTAPLLAAFLVPTSFYFHDFWRLEGQERQMQQINFVKNLAIMGGLISVAMHDLSRARESGAGWRARPVIDRRPDYNDLTQMDAA